MQVYINGLTNTIPTFFLQHRKYHTESMVKLLDIYTTNDETVPCRMQLVVMYTTLQDRIKMFSNYSKILRRI